MSPPFPLRATALPPSDEQYGTNLRQTDIGPPANWAQGARKGRSSTLACANTTTPNCSLGAPLAQLPGPGWSRQPNRPRSPCA